MKKKIAFLLAAVLLAITALTGCGDGQNPPSSSVQSAGESKAADVQTPDSAAVNREGFPIVDEPITLNALASRGSIHGDWKDMLVWQEYEKLTNVTINWDLVPEANFNERKNVLLASRDLPDIFYRSMISKSDEAEYGGQGLFVGLNDLIKGYAPNIRAMFEEHPDYVLGIAQADGNIYSLPQIIDYLAPRVDKGWINTKWLEQTGLDMPQTTDEYLAVLRAMKEIDYNGNGQADELPLSGNMEWADRAFIELGGAWGLGNRGMSAAGQHMDLGEDGKVRFFVTDDRYRELLKYFAVLWQEELMDKELFTQNASQFMAKGDENLVGSWLCINNASIVGGNKADYTAMPALEGPHGDRVWAAVAPAVASTGTFVISGSNPYPEATMRWVDYFYGKEGVKLLRMGIEGDTYTVGDDGTFNYTEKITDNPDGLSVAQAISQFSPISGGMIPQLMMEEFNKDENGGPASVEGAKLLEPYIPEDIWNFSFTPEEEQTMSPIRADVDTYVAEMRVKFVTREISFDQWDTYVGQLEKMGLPELLEIWNTAYERWTAGES